MSLGLDTASSEFFRNWYQTTDLGHYLDNFNDYTVYETETTGEWNIGNRNVFSIAGNSFKQSKYWLNGMRIDSRTMAGHTLLHTQMDRTSLLLDYHDGELFFTEDSVQKAAIRLTGKVGNLGGSAPAPKRRPYWSFRVRHLPRIRSTLPGCVPGVMVIFTSPVSVGICTCPPSTAVGISSNKL